ncbi:IclR family transcriptional regulator [Paraburkholderia sediminicola]
MTSGGSQTVDRALVALKAIVVHARPVSLDEISQLISLHKSVAYRLIRSLENAGFVQRDPVLGGYTVGSELLSLSMSVSRRLDVGRLARPSMELVVKEFGETASLHVRCGDRRVCVEVVDGTHSVRRVVPLGETLPIYAGESGRILLSGLIDQELQRQLDVAARNGIDCAALGRDVATAQHQGWIIGAGMRTPDVGSISIAIHGATRAVAALTVSGPLNRWTESAMKTALPRLLELIRPISVQFEKLAAE